MFFKLKKLPGFTLIELLTGVLITGIIAGAIMTGVTAAKSSLRAIQIREQAFNKLEGYTEILKGRITAAKQPVRPSNTTTECLEYAKDGKCKILGELFFHISPFIEQGTSERRYRLETRISWINNNNIKQQIDFLSTQPQF